jgi:hypothetical protein
MFMRDSAAAAVAAATALVAQHHLNAAVSAYTTYSLIQVI